MKRKRDAFLKIVRKRDGHELEFMQAVEEVAESVIPYVINREIYRGKNILLRIPIQILLTILKNQICI